MEKYIVSHSSPEKPKAPSRRHRWKRTLIELNGKFEPKYRHEIAGLFMSSYSELGAFPHLYHIDGTIRCQTHGIFLASATKSGCLTVHDFETLYCNSRKQSPCSMEEREPVLHLYTRQQLDVVKWNLANQDEVACTSWKSNEILIYDLGYVSSEPVEVLRKRPALSVNGYGRDARKGLYDIAFTSIDESRILASDVYGAINIWDRRMSGLPCLELSTDSYSILNSIELSVENQLVFGAGKNGTIYIWDLRGGRSQVAFQSPREVCHPPLKSLRLASMLQQIRSLKEQADIVTKEVHSIDLDPSCPYQLAFHLDDGWSGVLDIHRLQQHPVAINMFVDDYVFRNDSNTSASTSCLRRPSWLPKYSIYAVGSTTENGIHLLDFYPDSSSAGHVECSEEKQSLSVESGRTKQNRFVSSCEGVTVCATHPMNGTIIAGTKESSLLVMSQRLESC
ncbi:hypothetical protein RJ641_007396 [Dillenia turbinata]|uniref:Transducin/WD40 repeat-like superfamily protein n=1 Tax=Dillenia turbinata TaxID=194707 RepID=A0AAN8VDW0_9MAGN